MADIALKPLFDVLPQGFSGSIRLYQSESSPASFFIKQMEINKLLGYCRGCVSGDIDESFLTKIHDECRRLMNFVELSMCQDYIMCLPTVGKRRDLARNLNNFFREFKKCLSCMDGIDEVRKTYETQDLSVFSPSDVCKKMDADTIDRLNVIINVQKAEIQALKHKLEMINCAFLEYQSTLEDLMKTKEVSEC